MIHTGLTRDPLSAVQLFKTHHQLPSEKVNDFASNLKRLFTESYPSEAMTSATLLQCFVIGLSPPICRQLLLKGQPASLDDAIKSAHYTECALTFHPLPEGIEEVNVIIKASPQQITQRLEAALQGMTKRLKALDLKLESSKASKRELAIPESTVSSTKTTKAKVLLVIRRDRVFATRLPFKREWTSLEGGGLGKTLTKDYQVYADVIGVNAIFCVSVKPMSSFCLIVVRLFLWLTIK